MEIASPRVGFARWDMGGMPPHRCVHFIFRVERAFTASSGRGVPRGRPGVSHGATRRRRYSCSHNSPDGGRRNREVRLGGQVLRGEGGLINGSLHRILQWGPQALGAGQGCASRSGGPADRCHCSHPNLIRAAPPLRPDIIFGRHRRIFAQRQVRAYRPKPNYRHVALAASFVIEKPRRQRIEAWLGAWWEHQPCGFFRRPGPRVACAAAPTPRLPRWSNQTEGIMGRRKSRALFQQHRSKADGASSLRL